MMEDDAQNAGRDFSFEYGDDGVQAEFSNEELNPDVNDLFPEEQHVHWKGQSHPREPPKPLRYYSQDGNKPPVRQESATPSTASDSSSGSPFHSNESKDFDDVDVGQLFADEPAAVANYANDTLADRRNRGRPAELDLGAQKYRVGGSTKAVRKSSYKEPLSSAKFEGKLDQYVGDPEVKAKLLAEFRELNAGKNEIAIATWKLYEDKKKDYDEVMSTYWSGPGEERRRVKTERELRAKEVKEAKRKRKLEIALAAEMRTAEAAGLNGEWGAGAGGALISPESEEELSDELGSEDDEDEDGVSQREFYSPDSEEGNFQGYERLDGLNTAAFARGRDNDDDEWPGDRTSRVPLTASKAALQTGGYHTRASTLSTDKPLPSIPAAETAQTLTSIYILLRLIPLKAALAQHLSAVPTRTQEKQQKKEEIYNLCALAQSICRDAEDREAATALQGRCAFYMGLAEFLRSKLDEESEGIYALVVWYFDNAWKLCGGVYEEGVWGEQWARWVRGENGYFDGEGVRGALGAAESPGQGASRAQEGTADEGGLVGRMMAMFRSWSGGDRKGLAWNKGVPELEKAGRPEEVLRAEDVRDVDVERPRPPQKRSAIGLGIKTDGIADTEPIITSPDHAGIFASPESYDRSPITPTTYNIVNFGVHSPHAVPSQLPQDPPLPTGKRYFITNPDLSTSTASSGDGKRDSPQQTQSAPTTGRRYFITNPDLNSTESSGDSTTDAGASLPAPVTTSGSPAVSPGGTGIMSALTRRFSAAISPTSSSTQDHKSPSPDGGSETETTPSPGPHGQRLSLAARRRKSSAIAQISSMIRGGKAPMRSQDDLIEAEEGNSPMKADFDRDADGGVVRSSGVAKRSPLGDGGFGEGEEGGGLRRRRSGPIEAEEMV